MHVAHSDMANSRVASTEKMLLTVTQSSLQTQQKCVKQAQRSGSLQQGMLGPNLGAGVAAVCQLYIQSTLYSKHYCSLPSLLGVKNKGTTDVCIYFCLFVMMNWQTFLCKVLNFNKP